MRKTDIGMFARIAAAISGTLLNVNASPNGAGKVARRPTGKELRDPSNPNQQARIQAAAAKRERRAEKLARDSRMSRLCNPCNHVTLSDLLDVFGRMRAIPPISVQNFRLSNAEF